jgi:hypothetical protein
MSNAVFWDVAQCSCCVNRRFGGMYRLYLQGRKIRERGTSVSRWLQTATAVKTSNLTIHSCVRVVPTSIVLFSRT